MPAFMAFSDRTLREMARRRPASQDELLTIKGVGPAKCERFGQRFVEAIRSHVSP